MQLAKNTAKEGFQPLYDRVVIKLDPEATVTPGGLFIPEQGKQKPKTATVITIGTGRVNDRGEIFPLAVKPGDRVRLSSLGNDLDLDGVQYQVIHEEQIEGILINR